MFSNIALAYGFIYICLAMITAGIILLFCMKIKHNAALRKIEAYTAKHRDYFVYVQMHLHDDVKPQLPPAGWTASRPTSSRPS